MRMMKRIISLIAVVVLIRSANQAAASEINTGDAPETEQQRAHARSITVHRLVQHSFDGGAPLGLSRRSGFRGAARLHALRSTTTAEDANGAALVVDLDDASSPDAIHTLLTSKPKKKPAALMVVLPAKKANETVSWVARRSEQFMVNAATGGAIYGAPVFFVRRGDEDGALGEEMEAEMRAAAERGGGAFSGGLRVAVSAPDPIKRKPARGTNIEARLRGKSARRTILIVTPYDALAPAPSLAAGASTASSVAVMLELMRSLRTALDTTSKEQSSETVGGLDHYELVFVMAAAGALNFAGSTQFLNEVEPRLLETVDFVLCLDDLLGHADTDAAEKKDEEMYLHVSRPRTDATLANVFAALQASFKAVGVALHLVQRKVDLSNERVAWDHEHFSKRYLLAGTLSARATPRVAEERGEAAASPLRLSETSIFDVQVPGDAARIARTVVALGNGIVGIASRLSSEKEKGNVEDGSATSSSTETQILPVQDDDGSSEERIAALVGAVIAAPRVAFRLDAESDDGGIVEVLQRKMRTYAHAATTQVFTLDARYEFYTELSLTMDVYIASSLAFDVGSGIAVVVYLVLLYGAVSVRVRGWTKTVAMLKPKKL